MIKLTEIVNPFEPDSKTQNVKLVPNMTLDHIVRIRDMEGLEVYHNRYGLVPKYDWSSTYLKDFDEITIRPKIVDSNTVNTLLTHYILGPFSAFTGTVNFTGYAKSGWNASWKVISKLPSYIMSSSTSSSSSSDDDESQTYSFDAIQTTASWGTPIAILLGEHYLGGNVISYFTTQYGDNSYLNLLVALGKGPFTEIAGYNTDTDYADLNSIGSKILIGGNNVANLEGAQVFIRMGNDVQNVVPGFEQVYSMDEFTSVLLTQWNPYVRPTSKYDTTAITVHIKHSTGLYKMDDGEIEESYYTANIFYRVYGTTDWIYAGTYYKSGKTQSELKGSLTIYGLLPNRYEIQVVQTSPNSYIGTRGGDGYLYAFGLASSELLTYPGTALIGIKLLANSSISGAISQILTLCKGPAATFITEPNGELVTQFTQNPVWLVNELFTNKDWGIGDFVGEYGPSLNKLLIEAEYADSIDEIGQVRSTMNCVIDSQQSAMDWIRELCSNFRCYPMYANGKLSLSIDRKVDEIVINPKTFNMGNIIKDSFSLQWTSITDEYNVVEIQYKDSSTVYSSEFVTVEDSDSLASGVPANKLSVTAKGITNRQEATSLGVYFLKKAKYERRLITFKCMSINSIPGDLIRFAHDRVAYSLSSGRVNSGTANTVKLNRNVLIPALSGDDVVVIRVDHKDESSEVFEVLNPPGVYAANTAIVIDGIWNKIPEDFDLYTLGHQGREAKLFRITSISTDKDGNCEINAAEYWEEIYDNSTSAINVIDYSELPNPGLLPNVVSNIFYYVNRSDTPVVTVNYSKPDLSNNYGFWDHVEIHISSDDGKTYSNYGNDFDGNAEITGLISGKVYKIKLVSVSTSGKKSNWSDSPVAEIIVKPSLPLEVTGLELVNAQNNSEFITPDANFRWRPARSSSAKKFGDDTLKGAFGGARDKSIAGYRVAIYKYPTGSINENVLLREEFVVEESYSYTIDKNRQDNIIKDGPVKKKIVPARGFEIRVWAVDIFGQESEYPALLYVTNPKPDAPVVIRATKSGGGGAIKYYEVNVQIEVPPYYDSTDFASLVIADANTDAIIPAYINQIGGVGNVKFLLFEDFTDPVAYIVDQLEGPFPYDVSKMLAENNVTHFEFEE